VSAARPGCPDLGGSNDRRAVLFELGTLDDLTVAALREQAHDGAGIADLAADHRLTFRSAVRAISAGGEFPRPVLGVPPVRVFSRQAADDLTAMSYAMQATYPGLTLNAIADRWGTARDQLVGYRRSKRRRARMLAGGRDGVNDREQVE
jgi:hypothetical protein